VEGGFNNCSVQKPKDDRGIKLSDTFLSEKEDEQRWTSVRYEDIVF
jgi:hypothetical protein